jgi:arylsulfatase A-like enzyme
VKKSLYEGGYRVPFIAHWPGKVPANTVNNHVSAQFDIMQTLAELTGNKIINTDGISLLPTLTGKDASQEKHPHLYFEFAEGSGQVAVRLGDWKGIRKDMKADPNAPWELYDLAADVSEKNNVAAAHPDILARMADIARKEHVHPHILEWEFIDPIVKK